MSDGQRVLPFTRLCKQCRDAPIRVVPCGHTGTVTGTATGTDTGVEQAADRSPAIPAESQPTTKGGCEVCYGWPEEHENQEIHPHPFDDGHRRGPRRKS